MPRGVCVCGAVLKKRNKNRKANLEQEAFQQAGGVGNGVRECGTYKKQMPLEVNENML